MNESDDQSVNDEGSLPPKAAHGIKGPLLMYLTMVAAFAIIAIFVLHHVMVTGAATQ